MEKINQQQLENFNDAMLNVRRAHRLIYQYQRRMIDLIDFIRQKFDFPPIYNGVGGCKHFSDPLYRSSKNGYFKLSKNNWAWDFLCSYEFEYYLGEKFTKERANSSESSEQYAISLLQISDTGYFDSKLDNRLDVDNFIPEENSTSKLLFYFELKPKQKDWIWDVESIALSKHYCKSSFTHCHKTEECGNIRILYAFPMSSFINEESTILALQEFSSYVEKYAGISLTVL